MNLPIALALAGIPALASVINTAISSKNQGTPRVARAPYIKKSKPKYKKPKRSPPAFVQHKTAAYGIDLKQLGGKNPKIKRLL